MSDLDATAAYAKASGSADTARLGITGFCWGGRIVWLYSAHNGPGGAPKAGAAWYGQVSNATNALQTRTALDIASKAHAPVLGLYGGLDTHITQGQLEMMRKELAANPNAKKLASEIIVYPDAQHGFNADYRPSYNKADATDAWQKMLAFMKKNGV
jgi:carboxymethylenebutenolidase